MHYYLSHNQIFSLPRKIMTDPIINDIFRFPDAVIMTLILFLLSKSAISASFLIIYPFAGELYPTQLRGIAIGFSAYISGLGLIIIPFITYLVRKCDCIFKEIERKKRNKNIWGVREFIKVHKINDPMKKYRIEIDVDRLLFCFFCCYECNFWYWRDDIRG